VASPKAALCASLSLTDQPFGYDGRMAVLLVICLFLAAILYSSVGNAGASGYLAAMALFGLPADEMRPAALVLNIVAASIASVRFYRGGCFSWRVFRPFAVASVPMSYVGGWLKIAPEIFKPLTALVLLM
jgi:uncharacterized protein